jgi:hypothetical protein
MPRKPIDYSKTVFYKIVCNDLNIPDCYVGHTTQFTKRKAHHKSNCCNELSPFYLFPLYQAVRKNGGWDNWSMIPIEEKSLNSALEALRIEREWLEKLNATLNKQVPSTQICKTKAEYDKEFRERNRDRLLAKIRSITNKTKNDYLKLMPRDACQKI